MYTSPGGPRRRRPEQQVIAMLLFVFPTIGISSKRFGRTKSFKSFLRNYIPSRRKIHERIQHDGTARCLSADLVLAAAQTLTENWLGRLVGALAQALSPNWRPPIRRWSQGIVTFQWQEWIWSLKMRLMYEKERSVGEGGLLDLLSSKAASIR